MDFQDGWFWLASEIEQQKESMPNSSVWQHTSSGFLDKYLYKLSFSKFVSLNKLHYDFPLFSIHITASNLTIKQCKYMSVWCKNLELDNYAKGLLELHFQLAILPSHLRASLIQNRSVNSREQPNTNIQVDLWPMPGARKQGVQGAGKDLLVGSLLRKL